MGAALLPLGNLGSSKCLSFNFRHGYTICTLASFSLCDPLTLQVGRLMSLREGEHLALSSCIGEAASVANAEEPAPGSGARSRFFLLTSCPDLCSPDSAPGQSFCVKGFYAHSRTLGWNQRPQHPTLGLVLQLCWTLCTRIYPLSPQDLL